MPTTNETWRLLLSPLKGGKVILGIRQPEDITRVDERLQENAARFGGSLEGAENIRPRDIDEAIEYVILDDLGHIKFAIGGIPLKLLDYPKLPFEAIQEIPKRTGSTYGLLSIPFKDPSGQNVGTITAFHELSTCHGSLFMPG